jgi:hypothetical protein
VRVFGARGASGFALPVGSEAFEQSSPDLERGTLDYLQGLKVGVLVLGRTPFTPSNKKLKHSNAYFVN